MPGSSSENNSAQPSLGSLQAPLPSPAAASSSSCASSLSLSSSALPSAALVCLRRRLIGSDASSSAGASADGSSSSWEMDCLAVFPPSCRQPCRFLLRTPAREHSSSSASRACPRVDGPCCPLHHHQRRRPQHRRPRPHHPWRRSPPPLAGISAVVGFFALRGRRPSPSARSEFTSSES